MVFPVFWTPVPGMMNILSALMEVDTVAIPIDMKLWRHQEITQVSTQARKVEAGGSPPRGRL